MKNKKLMWIIGIISFVAAASAALTAFLIVKDKQKKDDEELMEYLRRADGVSRQLNRIIAKPKAVQIYRLFFFIWRDYIKGRFAPIFKYYRLKN